MGPRLEPYVFFMDAAEEALEFYRGVFGGTVTLTRFAEYGPDDTPDAHRVLHGVLRSPSGFSVMAADTPAGAAHEPGRNVALNLDSEDEDELTRWFTDLAEGGRVIVPLEEQVWGGLCGQLVDRFGIVWLIGTSPG